MKAQPTSAAGRFLMFLLLTSAFFFAALTPAFADSVAPPDTGSITAVAEPDTASTGGFVSEPEQKIMGISAGLFWTYLAMGVGLVVVVVFAYVTSVSKEKKASHGKKR